jgi:cellulose synthase/poly-beta-1,6-N-acetylglucosamine synthase-like glycosyltransferase
MSTVSQLKLVQRRVAQPRPAAPSGTDLGDALLARGHLSAGDLSRARARSSGQAVTLEEVLRLHGTVPETVLGETQALLHRARFFAAEELSADVRLIDALGPGFCLRRKVLPVFRAGAETVVVTAAPDAFAALRDELTAALGPVRMAIAAPSAIEAALLRLRQRSLARMAESRVPAVMSSRGRMAFLVARGLVVASLVALSIGLLAPAVLFTAAVAWAVLTLVATAGLKVTAAIAALRDRRSPEDDPAVTPLARSPVVSILVPLFREREIAGRLVARLGRIDYPSELLDILLVVEESDTITQETIARTRLPSSMRQIVVPRGGVQTKPRALNYALDFCRGSIVGVYDAEDRPAPQQIRDVVAAFATRPPEVACLQGILDYYNARQNWFSRCFTVEYATWFRLVLRGFARLGLVVPLGGTTLFFRREALERLGGWDAHNVTEDADLGVRLVRHGYRADLIETVTEEEANCRAWPWVRQRSRWLKGYAMTYAVHMRDPAQLWRDLGPRRFLGVQITFLGTLSQFALAPVLWSFWLLFLGLPHPFAEAPAALVWTLVALFLASELANIAIGAVAVARPSHRWLIPWVPTLHLYHMLGAIAAWKGLAELVFRPFFWDKTEHGFGLPDKPVVAVRRTPPPPRMTGSTAEERFRVAG